MLARTLNGRTHMRIALSELLAGTTARVLPDSPGISSSELEEPAGVILASLSDEDKARVRERAEHVREVLTGYRSGTPELSCGDEPRSAYDPSLRLTDRYAAKGKELGVRERTIQRWVADLRTYGEAGLARTIVKRKKPLGSRRQPLSVRCPPRGRSRVRACVLVHQLVPSVRRACATIRRTRGS